MQIYILTLGRLNKQITYNSIPESWKENTIFVVQPHEYKDFLDKYGNSKVICLPIEINNLPLTRKWVFENLGYNKRHLVLDDDLSFLKKYPNPNNISPKWLTETLTETDFDDILTLINSWMDEGYSYGGLMTTANIPDTNPKRYPIRTNHRLMTNFFFDGEKIPKDLIWNRVPFGEDIDITLQLLSKGFQNRCSSHYIVNPSKPNSNGGVSLYRSLEKHNNSQELLAKLWPKYVRIIDKPIKDGLIKKFVTIQFKKVYTVWFKNNLSCI